MALPNFLGSLTNSLRKQLIIGVALVHAVMMTLFVYDLTERQQEFLVESQLASASSLAHTLSLAAITPLLSSDLAGLQELTRALSSYPGVAHVMVIHNNGKILSHSDVARRGLFAADLATFSDLLDPEPRILLRNRALVDVVVPVLANNKRLGWVRIGVGQSATADQLQNIGTDGLVYTLLAILIGALLAWLMASRMTHRLARLHRVANAVSDGNMNVRVEHAGNDEVGHLASAFNMMLDMLAVRAGSEKQLQLALQAETELAKVTLASIGDAVITTDAEGRITFMNTIAEGILERSSQEVEGQHVLEVYRVLDAETGQPVSGDLHRLLGLSVDEDRETQPVLLSQAGEKIHIEDSSSPIRSATGELLGCVLVFRDITDKFQTQQKIAWQAVHDPLTRLPNRFLLADRLNRAIDTASRNKHILAVCVIDLDQFKPVNDIYGHAVGDQLLIRVAERLSCEMRSVDTVCRLGGDEFVLLFESVDDILDLRRPLKRIVESLIRPFDIESHQIQVSASIGVTVYPFDNADADTLLRHADQAMYMAKQAGRNQIIWFDVNQDLRMQEAHRTISSVRQAFERGELTLYYQPKVDMRTGQVLGMEALLRWIDPAKGVVAPGEFLPHVEHSSLIVDIGEWVIETAIRQAIEWAQAGRLWSISVNIAARHIQMSDFVEKLRQMLASYPALPAHRIEIEILESVALNDVEQTRHLILEVQKLGVDFALDDFGTGYSSLKYLKQLPVDCLKIDQTFVRDLLEDQDDRAVVSAVIGLASAFNRQVIAEGVETDEHMQMLLKMGCDFGQGYGIARPMPAGAVLGWADKFALKQTTSTCSCRTDLI